MPLPLQIALTVAISMSTSMSSKSLFFAHAASAEAEARVTEIVSKLKADTLSFRDELERVYSDRCSAETLTDCAKGSYSDCTSAFPGQEVCMDPSQECNANAFWDKTVTKVSIPAALAVGEGGNPTDPELVETVCYSRVVEPYLVEKFARDEEYWGQYGVSRPGGSYFGAHNGIFRQIPANYQQTCGLYDPRLRPWYVAASSGPKDVVLVIDTSGSMDDYDRIGLAVQAATTIIETLTVADRIAVVPFDTTAKVLTDENDITVVGLVRATRKNKNALLTAISSLKANGGTNFYDAFDKTFELIERTIQQESTSGCNVAVLFLTDGVISYGPGAEEVINLVSSKATEIKSKYDRDFYLFSYSLGLAADSDVPKRLACETGGIWAQVDDAVYGGDIVSAMAGYYKLFALGLGEGDNADFVSIVEPYPDFSTGKMITTVSAPVYDRNVSPPLLLGVVGIDSYMDALEQVLGVDASSTAMLNRFIALSTARCPRLNLTGCELDALRYLGGGDQAICGDCPSVDNGGGSYVGIVPQQCRGVSDLPRNVWANNDNIRFSFEEKACCKLEGTIAPTGYPSDKDTRYPSDTSNTDKTSNTAAITIAVVGVLALFAFLFCMRKQARNKQSMQPQNTENNGVPCNEVKTPYKNAGIASAPPVPLPSPVSPEYIQN
mmetsp:Transcript_6412/g.13432  ORF Transcript_6412/g.13432 Transcript_6412/m.13432 type:complete len:665 (-) Transcript_6412:123-2117(-)|eukprot:CAMPEP_0194317346 /NCGR_PEP_ID=MMETSP0171-20130528/14087_1 /TAXON_ID=218684 /ORGANISM="Corethron pennatum, Strain L29A3" /LENGTH=664 /DNA_ID=CAMNT_0039073889 /DNA_START=202 /DNA_END=2196 /DNA_ORIENTATION=+